MKTNKEDMKKFLDKVRLESKSFKRYDNLIDNNTWNSSYDNTDSVFIYEYKVSKDYKHVVVFMNKGEYIDYFVMK